MGAGLSVIIPRSVLVGNQVLFLTAGPLVVFSFTSHMQPSPRLSGVGGRTGVKNGDSGGRGALGPCPPLASRLIHPFL